MPCVLRVAVGSNDKIHFNTSHFGESRYFIIYDVYENGSIIFKEIRVNNASDMEEEMHGDPRKFKAVISQLTDVDVLLAYAMGPNFKRIIGNSNKVPYIVKGTSRRTKRVVDGLKEALEKFESLYKESQLRKAVNDDKK